MKRSIGVATGVGLALVAAGGFGSNCHHPVNSDNALLTVKVQSPADGNQVVILPAGTVTSGQCVVPDAGMEAGAESGTCDAISTACSMDAGTCCSGLGCAYNPNYAGNICCVPLKGSTCTGVNDCCPAPNVNIGMSCTAGVCCVAHLANCSQSSDCCSGGCAIEPPGVLPGLCAQDWGQPCSVPSDCFEPFCNGGICCRVSGQNCGGGSISKSCCSGVCNSNGVCQ